ncbi:type II toxin-antitoxin system Phd/YefM family antitoxin [Nocardia sp. NPDC055321]
MTRTITQAELRTGSAGVLDALAAGEDFVITRNGRPVGELRPIVPTRDLTVTELEAVLARIGRSGSGVEERAEIDAAFSEERLDE